MRTTLLTIALLTVAVMVRADEPSAPPAKAEAATETPAKPAEPVAASETKTASIAAAKDDDKPFKPPTGYKTKRVNGEVVYCTKVVVLGTRFPQEDCRNEAQLRDMERSKQSMRDDLNRARTCSGGGCNFN